jgi:hypothetical protein
METQLGGVNISILGRGDVVPILLDIKYGFCKIRFIV